MMSISNKKKYYQPIKLFTLSEMFEFKVYASYFLDFTIVKRTEVGDLKFLKI